MAFFDFLRREKKATVRELLTVILQNQINHMAKLTDLAGRLANVETVLLKARDEIVAELAKLRDQLGNVDIPADAEATLGRLDALSAALDELNPDAPPPPPPA